MSLQHARRVCTEPHTTPLVQFAVLSARATATHDRWQCPCGSSRNPPRECVLQAKAEDSTDGYGRLAAAWAHLKDVLRITARFATVAALMEGFKLLVAKHTPVIVKQRLTEDTHDLLVIIRFQVAKHVHTRQLTCVASSPRQLSGCRVSKLKCVPCSNLKQLEVFRVTCVHTCRSQLACPKWRW